MKEDIENEIDAFIDETQMIIDSSFFLSCILLFVFLTIAIITYPSDQAVFYALMMSFLISAITDQLNRRDKCIRINEILLTLKTNTSLPLNDEIQKVKKAKVIVLRDLMYK